MVPDTDTSRVRGCKVCCAGKDHFKVQWKLFLTVSTWSLKERYYTKSNECTVMDQSTLRFVNAQ